MPSRRPAPTARRQPRRPRAIALAAGLALAAGGAGAAQRLATGASDPSLPAGTRIVAFSTPLMDSSGALAVTVTLAGPGITAANDSALWTDAGLFRHEGTAAPNVAGGVLTGAMGALQLAPGGQPVWRSALNLGSSVQLGLWSGSTPLMVTGTAAPSIAGATVTFFSNEQVARDGRVGLLATLSGSGVTAANSSALYVDRVLQARTGSAAGGTEAGTVFSSFTSLVVGAGGRAVYTARLAGPSVTAGNGEGLWAGTTLLARTGAQAAGMAAGATYTGLEQTYGFEQNHTNTAGQVLFRGRWAYAGTTGTSLWLDQTPVATLGSAAGGMGPGAVLTSFGYTALNDAGQVMWAGTARGGASLAENVGGIWRNGTLLVREGAVVPGAGGAVLGALPIVPFADRPGFNNQGLVSFAAGLEGPGVDTTNNRGLFITDGIDLVTVVRKGDTRFGPAGSPVTALTAGSFGDRATVAVRLRFADGSEAIHDFTPDLQWRAASGGRWDDAANWTLGLRPDAPYRVAIDPAASLTVTGPAGAVTVASLAVGGGSGVAVLNLAGGRIASVSGPVQVHARGVLGGSGTIAAGVASRGEVRADNVTIEGGLDNQGTVRGAASGPARLTTDLTNRAAGWVQVGPGERLLLDGNGHANAGTIELRGGELRIDRGALANASGGRVLLNDGRLLALAGLRNEGQVQVSFGESEVFGAIANAAGGKIILSGGSRTSFYDALDVARGAELRISAGASAVFFGTVHQRNGALFTGSGTKFYEGGLNIGDSPGLGSDGGDVSFGAGNVYVAEIGGLEPGSGHDQYRVAGHLAFGGTLQIVSWAGYTGQAGTAFDLFDWGSTSGRFDIIDSSGLVLAPGAALDLSDLYVDGRIAVVAVPEPGTWALFGAGALLLAGLRRRRR